MKPFPKNNFIFKECKKCPEKNKKQKNGAIISSCQNCIEQGKAVPPPQVQTEIKY